MPIHKYFPYPYQSRRKYLHTHPISYTIRIHVINPKRYTSPREHPHHSTSIKLQSISNTWISHTCTVRAEVLTALPHSNYSCASMPESSTRVHLTRKSFPLHHSSFVIQRSYTSTFHANILTTLLHFNYSRGLTSNSPTSLQSTQMFVSFHFIR